MKELRAEIYNMKENIYSANIEKRKLNEKLYTLSEMSKKVDEGYDSYKEITDKISKIKSVKDVMNFKNVNLKTRVASKRNNINKKDVNYKNEAAPTDEFVATSEIKEAYNKLHYNDKMTLEENKSYFYNECKELLIKQTSNSSITLFASLDETSKYEIETGFCETMIKGYPDLEKLQNDNDLLIIDVPKNSHYIPVMNQKGDYCTLVGGDLKVLYKEKINTGEKSVSVWHVKKG